jgi:hypothetical protein
MLYPIELRAHLAYFKHFEADLVKDGVRDSLNQIYMTGTMIE